MISLPFRPILMKETLMDNRDDKQFTLLCDNAQNDRVKKPRNTMF